MARDLFFNNATTTVASAHGIVAAGTQETWTVASSALFVDAGARTAVLNTTQFRVADPADAQQPPEVIQVVSVSGTTWIVVRGAEGTAPTAHAAGFTVAAIATASSLEAAGAFDQTLNLYTPPGVMTTKTRAKMAGVAAGVGSAKLCWIGASMTAGYDGATTQRGIQDIPFRMNAMLGSLGYSAGEPALVFDDVTAFDTRFALTGSWTHVTQPAAAMYSTSTSAGTVTLNSSRIADSFRLTFPGTSTAFTLKIDGAFPAAATVVGATYTAGSGTVTPSGTSAINSIVVTGLPKIPHVALLTVATGMIPYSAEFYLTNSLRLANWGQSSTMTSHWADVSAFNTELNQVLNWGPDVVVLMLDEAANDYNNVIANATTVANLGTIITTLQAAGVEVILFTPPPFLGLTGTVGGLNNPPPSYFWQNFYNLADTYGCWLVDNNARWVNRAIAFGLAEYGADNFHTSSLGFQDLTCSLLAVMAQQIVDPWLPQSLQNLTSGAAYTIPAAVSKGGSVLLVLTASCTITMAAASAGARVTLALKQDATGSRLVTWSAVSWGTAGAPTLSTAANKTDLVTLICLDGTNWLGFLTGTAF